MHRGPPEFEFEVASTCQLYKLTTSPGMFLHLSAASACYGGQHAQCASYACHAFGIKHPANRKSRGVQASGCMQGIPKATKLEARNCAGVAAVLRRDTLALLASATAAAATGAADAKECELLPTPSGLQFCELTEGDGPEATSGTLIRCAPLRFTDHQHQPARSFR
jgi:hypothetical protein